MRRSLLTASALAGFLVLPLTAQAQVTPQSGAASGATTGAIGGAIVGGPVGAAVGAGIGGLIGGLSADQSTQVRQYVVTQRRPSVRLQEEVVVGGDLPGTVQLYEIPDNVAQTEYRYGIVNDRTVIVDPRTRRVVTVVE